MRDIQTELLCHIGLKLNIMWPPANGVTAHTVQRWRKKHEKERKKAVQIQNACTRCVLHQLMTMTNKTI